MFKRPFHVFSIIFVNIIMAVITMCLFTSINKKLDASFDKLDASLTRVELLLDKLHEVLKEQAKPIYPQSFRPYHDEMPQPVDTWMIEDPQVK